MKHLVTSVLVVFGLSAHAYHLDEHRAITTQAFHELTGCFPQYETFLNLEWIASGNVEEDTDVLTKWLFYSHYYHPNKELAMRRSDSSVRVSGLASHLRNPETEGVDITEMTNMGHMIHHFQDATVPSHVTPVNHALWDGYETYQVSDFSSGLSCEEIVRSSGEPTAILKETAQATLNNIRALRFDFIATVDGTTNRINASGEAFWLESSDNSFGQYGYLGNNFGAVKFSVGKISYQVAQETYQEFKKAQLQLAVRATIRALMWELGGILKRPALSLNNSLDI